MARNGTFFSDRHFVNSLPIVPVAPVISILGDCDIFIRCFVLRSICLLQKYFAGISGNCKKTKGLSKVSHQWNQ